ncbi:MAG: heavy metal translocating P-type ATPase [Chloroflexota bacterium]
MLFGCLVTGGALAASVKVYKDTKKKKKRPFFRLVDQKRFLVGPVRNKTLVEVLAIDDKAKSETHTFRHQKSRPLFGDLRERQLQDISSARDAGEKSEFEKVLDHHCNLALLACGLIGAGVFYTPLLFVGVPLLIYLKSFSWKNFFIERRHYGPLIIDAISDVVPVVAGYFFAASLTTVCFYFNRRLLHKTEDHSMQNLANVFGEQPRSVWVFKNGVEVEIPFDELRSGDLVVINAGEMIPIDGTVTNGVASVDQRSLTGESQPAEKGVGDEVLCLTVVLSGRIVVEAEKAGEETVAAQVGHILGETTDFKRTILSRGEAVVDRWSWPTLAAAAITLRFMGAIQAAAVGYSGFGYHMRYSAPIGLLNFLGIASQQGILVKDGRSLELLSQVDTVVFDKTGTLTQEQPHVGTIYTCDAINENELLRYAAAAEHKQAHPIAQAIISEAINRGLEWQEISEATIEVGYGLKVCVEEQSILIGSDRFMEMNQIAIPAEIQQVCKSGYEQGYSFIYIAIDARLGGVIELRPTIRPEAKHIIASLSERGLTMYIISGDHEAPTQKLASELGIDHYFARALPEDKSHLIAGLQDEGKKVCFIGDGINDSIALKKAHVSVSLRGASTIATDSASIVLMDQSLNRLVQVFDIADKLKRNQDVCYLGSIVPGVICVSGVWLFHMGLVGAMMLYYASLGAGVAYAMLPLLNHRKVMEKTTLLDNPEPLAL